MLRAFAGTPILHHSIFIYHAMILPENNSISKRTVHLTRFSFQKSKWTLPPILALLARYLWCFTFAEKGGRKKKIALTRENKFFKGFRAKDAKGAKVWKKENRE